MCKVKSTLHLTPYTLHSSMNKLRIKKGDTVKVLSGKDKGKTGKVIKVMPKIGKITVENVNTRTKFEKSKKAGRSDIF